MKRTRRSAAEADVSELERALDVKTFDGATNVSVSSLNTAAPATTPFALVSGASGGCINQVPRGNTANTRVGRRFRNKAVRVCFYWPQATSAQAYSGNRAILFWDRSPNQASALPSWANLRTAQLSTALPLVTNATRFVPIKE
nr:MAG: hypothetical protein [Arizlama virus]